MEVILGTRTPCPSVLVISSNRRTEGKDCLLPSSASTRPSRGLTLTPAALRQKWVRLSQALQTSFLFIASMRKAVSPNVGLWGNGGWQVLYCCTRATSARPLARDLGAKQASSSLSWTECLPAGGGRCWGQRGSSPVLHQLLRLARQEAPGCSSCWWPAPHPSTRHPELPLVNLQPRGTLLWVPLPPRAREP